MDMSGGPAFVPETQPVFQQPQVPPQILEDGRKMLYVHLRSLLCASSGGPSPESDVED